MKNLFYCCIAICAIAFLQSCSDQDNAEDVQIESEISKTRDGHIVPTLGGGDPECDLSVCQGNWLPANFVTWGFGVDEETCELCAWVIFSGDGEGDLCISLTNVTNLETGEAAADTSFSGTVSSGEQVCITLEFAASFYVTTYFITDEGCTKNEDPYYVADCCVNDPALMFFTEVDTDNLYKTFCGTIEVELVTPNQDLITWEYYPEPGTGLKGSGTGTGKEFNIIAQNDCGLLGPGEYTVTFTDANCFEYTDTYYFEPCNTDLYSPGNPAAMQMSSLNVFCIDEISYEIRLTSSDVAKCCSCIGEDVDIKIINGNGDEQTFEGDVLMEAGCQPASSWFKRHIVYNGWTPTGNIIEVYDCEGNLIYTTEDDPIDDPCL